MQPAPTAPVASESDPSLNRADLIAQRRAKAQAGPPRPAPGPRGMPLVGVAPKLRKGMYRFFLDCAAEYGPTFRLPFGKMSMLAVSHPDQMERVLVSGRDNYPKGWAYDGLRDLSGDNLITLNGEAHKARRRLAQPSFHRGSVDKLVQAIVDTAEVFFADAAKKGERVVDMHREMTGLTLDAVVEALFGRGLSEQAEVPYAILRDALAVVGERGGGAPLPTWIPTPANLKFKRTKRGLDDAVTRVIRAARARYDSGERDGTLISMLLDARDEDTGAALTDDELMPEAIGLFIAGHETTALTMTWLFTYLDDAPEVKARLIDEVESVLAGRSPSFADVPKLAYTRQIIDELLRLRPAAWVIARNAADEDNLGGFAVHKNDLVVPCIYLTHRHPDFWPDAERFDPERFSSANKKGRENWAYIPFSGGPRVCIGNTFSLVETTVLLAMLVQRFSFERVGNNPEPAAFGTLRPDGPVHVKLTPR
jgi:cytochrome P450